MVHQKCRSSSGCDKFHVYIEDMEKIVRLLLNLSGQLGRAESSVQSLAGGADRKILVGGRLFWLSLSVWSWCMCCCAVGDLSKTFHWSLCPADSHVVVRHGKLKCHFHYDYDCWFSDR